MSKDKKIRSNYQTFVIDKFYAQSYQINNIICKHTRTENDRNWEREQKNLKQR